MFEPEFWVAVAFFIFVAFLGYIGAHRMILASLDAEIIISNAQAEAERVAAEAHARMEELVARRTAVAQAKIAQAEAQALADVRAAAADAAVAAAEKILREAAKGKVADELIAEGIAQVKARLH